MKNVSDSFQVRWQENKQQLHNLLEQQNQLMANLLDENATLQASLQTGNAFLSKTTICVLWSKSKRENYLENYGSENGIVCQCSPTCLPPLSGG